MKRTHRITAACIATLAGAAALGCASRPTDHIVFVGSMQPQHGATTVASLAAGDALGQAIYSNDVILASTRTRTSQPALIVDADDNQD